MYLCTINNLKEKKMTNQYQIGQTVTFKTTIFGSDKIMTNVINSVNIEDGEILYSIHGVGQILFGRDLKGSEDCFIVSENNIINK